MSRIALLIGVRRYQASLNLPSRGQGVKALHDALIHVGIASEFGYDRSHQEITEAIESFFKNRSPDDQLIFLFAGYGFQDSEGKLYFITPTTTWDSQGRLIKATTISASFLQDVMNSSPAKQQIVILDCCFQPAVKNHPILSKQAIALWNQFSGKGRVILTAFTALQPAIALDEAAFWSYSHYLAEGLRTGAADIDGDGTLAIEDLHQYAKRKLQVAAPSVEPALYGTDETAKTTVLELPAADAARRYRLLLEQRASRIQPDQVDETGSKLLTGRLSLEEIRQSWGLPTEQSAETERQVLRPLREFQQRLAQYEQQSTAIVQSQNGTGITPQIIASLEQLQHALNLTDSNVATTKTKLLYIAPEQKQQEQYRQDLAWYQQRFLAAAQRQFPLSEGDRQDLQYLQQLLKLKEEDVKASEMHFLMQRQGFAEVAQPLETELADHSRSAAQAIPDQPEIAADSTSRNREAIQEVLLKRNLTASPSTAEAVTVPPAVVQSTMLQSENPAATSSATRPPAAAEPIAPLLNEEPTAATAQRNPQWARFLLIPFIIAIAFVAGLAGFLASQNPKPGFFSTMLNSNKPAAGQSISQYYTQGQTKVQAGKYQEAIDEYNEAVKLDQNNAAIYINRGFAYHKLGNLNAAFQDYDLAINILQKSTQAITLKPLLARAFSNRSHVRYDRQDFQGAFADANAAVAHDGKLAYAHINLGNARLKTSPSNGNTIQNIQAAALYDYQRAIDLNPDAPILSGAYTNRGNVLLAQNNPKEAIQAYDQAIRTAPSNAEAYYNRAIAFQVSKEPDKAIADFQKAADLYTSQGQPALAELALSQRKEVQPSAPALSPTPSPTASATPTPSPSPTASTPLPPSASPSPTASVSPTPSVSPSAKPSLDRKQVQAQKAIANR